MSLQRSKIRKSMDLIDLRIFCMKQLGHYFRLCQNSEYKVWIK